MAAAVFLAATRAAADTADVGEMGDLQPTGTA
jgi:hypothetical protein